MDDTISGTRELDEKLSKEMERLTQLKESLSRSNQLKVNMISTLNAFDERLEKLENTIKPVCDETENLQRRHENIEKSLVCLDNVLGFYDITAAVEQVIKDQPSNVGIDNYLSKMNDLQKAVNFFTKNSPGSNEMSNVTSLYDAGKDSLEREFRAILTRHSKPVPAILTLDTLAEDEELPREDISIIEHLPVKVHSDLCSIAQWLLTCDDHNPYLDVYTSVRGNILRRSMQGLKDHLKSGSKDSANASYSPAVTGKVKGRDNTRKAMKRMQFVKKASENLMKHSLSTFESAGLKRAAATDSKDDATQVDIDFFITSVSALLILVQSEQQLMERIIPTKHKKKVFDKIIRESLEILMKDGEQIASNVKRAAQRNDYPAVLAIFPVVKHLRIVRPEMDKVLDGCSTSTRSLLPKTISHLDLTGAKAMEDFVESVKHDPNKATNMPKDGTVHELTSNTIIFLEQMLEFSNTAGQMLIPSVGSARHGQSHASKQVAEYITRVLSALGLNLNNKAETYSDPILRAIFMLNNYNYILKSLKRSALLEHVKVHNPDLQLHYEDLIMEQKRLYSQSWSRVMHFIQDAKHGHNLMESGKLKDKDKQAIKDKYTGFNKEIEELRRVQKSYALPDPDLQESLTQDNLEFVLPAYRAFIDKYRLAIFTKNPEKYIKYSVQDVKRIITHFFDSSA